MPKIRVLGLLEEIHLGETPNNWGLQNGDRHVNGFPQELRKGGQPSKHEGVSYNKNRPLFEEAISSMRNLLTVTALLISMTGIVVSLAREELRCKLGLQSGECTVSVEETSPSVTSQTIRRAKTVSNPAQTLMEKLPSLDSESKAITPGNTEDSQGQKSIQKPTLADPKTPPVREETQPIAPPAQEKMTPESSQETAQTSPAVPPESSGQSSPSVSTQPSAPSLAPDGQPIPVIPPEPQTSQP